MTLAAGSIDEDRSRSAAPDAPCRCSWVLPSGQTESRSGIRRLPLLPWNSLSSESARGRLRVHMGRARLIASRLTPRCLSSHRARILRRAAGEWQQPLSCVRARGWRKSPARWSTRVGM